MRHWSSHSQDFALNINDAQYEALADKFMGERLRPTVLPCQRTHGDRVRYDPATGTFGVVSQDGILRTYFKPIPCSWIPAAFVDKRWCHAHPDTLTYFQVECRK